MTTGGRIIGWGTALPDKVLTNDDLSAMMDTNDQWITERTGIKRRHVGGSTSSLSVASAQRAIAMAGVDPSSID
ncbi:MAG: 3-oxoacyl-ACP synthase, partial [Ilumatobacteraceae bacterium]